MEGQKSLRRPHADDAKMTRKSQKCKHLGKDISHGRTSECIGPMAGTRFKCPMKSIKGGRAEATVRR